MIDIQVEIGAGVEEGFLVWFREEISRNVKRTSERSVSAITSWSQNLIRNELRSSPVYQQLKLGGYHAGELGLGPNEQHKVEECIEYVSRSVITEVIRPAGDNLGGIRVVLLSGGVPELLQQEFSEYISASRKKARGTPIGSHIVPWLEWLLISGSAVVVTGYHISFMRPSGSRTGQAIMIPGGTWALPNAGDMGDNWIENTLRYCATTIGERIVSELTKAMS